MLSNKIIGSYNSSESAIPEYYVLATDSDFSGTTDGSFRYTGSKPFVIIPEIIKGVTVTSCSRMFQSNTVIRGIANTSEKITNLNYIFNGCSTLTSLELSSFNTKNITRMTGMFYNCNSMTSLDLLSFNTSKVTDMVAMFFGCSSLTTLDLSSFSATIVTGTDNMFQNCSKVTTSYARSQSDATKFNSSTNKPANVNFIVKP